jgi:hypothetical protein
MRPSGLLAFAAVVASAALLACSGGGASPAGSDPPPPPSPGAADITLLFMGNSHTAYHDLPGMVAAMVRAARPGRTVWQQQAPGSLFLEERANDPATLELLQNRSWSFVVLQAQKYSTSGMFDYPIDGAVDLARRARASRAVPILFPEWPRLGVPETQRIYDLHVSIARQEPACVAPIPQAFDLALGRHPTLVLHDRDGNHSSAAGAFLAALVIASTMTGFAPDALPGFPQFGPDAETQRTLRAIAAETVVTYPPRMHCPADPLLR